MAMFPKITSVIAFTYFLAVVLDKTKLCMVTVHCQPVTQTVATNFLQATLFGLYFSMLLCLHK